MNTDKNFNNKKIILASQSPRRHSLIKKLNIDFDVVLPDFDEKLDTDNYSDESIKSLSLKKAMSVLENKQGTDFLLCKNSLIVSADTVVVLDNKIYGKPKNEENAKQMLKQLSDKTHFVATAVSVVDADTKKFVTRLVKTYVTFQNLSDELIASYVTNNKPLDKAGAYGIQEMGNEFIKNVDGDLENVIGLPTKTLKEMLEEFGYEFCTVD